MNLFRSLIIISSALAFAATPTAAQNSDTGTTTTSNASPASGSSSSSSGSSSPAISLSTSSASFGNLTTTNSLGSTIVTSIPITIPLNTTTATTSSSAQFPSLTGYPTCVVNCLTYAVAQTNCTSITAVSCYCPSQLFPNALYACVAGNCSTNVPSSENLAQQFCALDNVTVSFSATAAPSLSSLSATSPTSTSSHSSTTSNAALTVSWTSDTRGWVTMMVAACSALFGVALL